jgi:hypothetical protein
VLFKTSSPLSPLVFVVFTLLFVTFLHKQKEGTVFSAHSSSKVGGNETGSQVKENRRGKCAEGW